MIPASRRPRDRIVAGERGDRRAGDGRAGRLAPGLRAGSLDPRRGIRERRSGGPSRRIRIPTATGNGSRYGMAYDEGLAERVRDALGDRVDVTERKMFGGLAFMARGHMFVGILGDTLMARVGPGRYVEALRLPGVREDGLHRPADEGVCLRGACGHRGRFGPRALDRRVLGIRALAPAQVSASRSAVDVADALAASRVRTLSLYAHLTDAQREFPRRTEVNPPRWELGHIGWFQEFWCRRHAPDDPDGTRTPSRIPHADGLWNSARVPHETRWDLPLPRLGWRSGLSRRHARRHAGSAGRRPGRPRPLLRAVVAAARGHARRSAADDAADARAADAAGAGSRGGVRGRRGGPRGSRPRVCRRRVCAGLVPRRRRAAFRLGQRALGPSGHAGSVRHGPPLRHAGRICRVRRRRRLPAHRILG